MEELLVKYFKGECSKDEVNQVENWKNLGKQNIILYNQYEKIWQESGRLFENENTNKKLAWSRIRQKMKKVTTEKETRVRWLNNWVKAAVILIFIGVGFLAALRFNSKSNHKNMVRVAAITDKAHVNLPDGSEIWLNKGAFLTYTRVWKKNKRDVYLEGEGYFNIAKDTEKPFTVHAGDYNIRVLGTSFNVKQNGNNAEVALYEGNVRFFKNVLIKSKVDLIPGEMAIGNANGDIEKTTINDKNLTAWKTGILIFEDAELGDVCRTLADYYQKKIYLNSSDNFSKLRLTATFDNQTLDDVLDIICTTLNLSFEENNYGIILNKQK